MKRFPKARDYLITFNLKNCINASKNNFVSTRVDNRDCQTLFVLIVLIAVKMIFV